MPESRLLGDRATPPLV